MSNIPYELTKLLQWVCWGVDPDNIKMPYNPKDLTQAKANNPTTWGSYQNAMICVSLGEAKGVGFEFYDNNIVGVDLDNCRNPDTGEVKEWAQKMVDDLDSFTEISVSGTGLHIFIIGKKPGKQCKKVLDNNTDEAVEIYENGRYFAMTGNVYHQKPLADRTAELKAIYEWLWPKQPAVQEAVLRPKEYKSHTEHLSIGLDKDTKFKSLWNGQRDSADESSNDMALMNKLAYWCNGDKEAMIQAFKVSPFALSKDEAHTKKIQRADYLSRTADGAITSCRSTAAQDDYKWQQSHSKQPATEPLQNGLSLISAQDLQIADLPPVKYLVDGILPIGTTILSAASKIGKSWLVLLLGLTIAAGERFWGKLTEQGGVLYMALEDTQKRLQDRMNKVLNGKPAPAQFYFVTKAPNLDNGLLDLLDSHLKQHPETKLIIIDTLQKIRGHGTAGSPYQQDYKDMGMVKEFMDKKNISVLFVHHNRKMADRHDPYNMISGTTGIMGAADTIFVITKTSRFDENATLHITGRDLEDCNIVMRLDRERCHWELVGNAKQIAAQEAKAEYENNLIVQAVKALLDRSLDNSWGGPAQKLFEDGKRLLGTDIATTAQSVSYALRDLVGPLYDYDKIVYKTVKKGTAGKVHYFYYEPDTQAEDTNISD